MGNDGLLTLVIPLKNVSGQLLKLYFAFGPLSLFYEIMSVLF